MDYTNDLAQWIADEYASDNGSLHELAAAHPDRCPSPQTIRVWRKRYPQFDLMMKDSEVIKADRLAHETIGIADAGGNPQAIKQRIASRQWLAGKLDRKRFGSDPAAAAGSATVNVTNMYLLNDDQLMKIAAGNVIELRPDEYQRTIEDNPPIHVLAQGDSDSAHGTHAHDMDTGPAAGMHSHTGPASQPADDKRTHAHTPPHPPARAQQAQASKSELVQSHPPQFFENSTKKPASLLEFVKLAGR